MKKTILFFAFLLISHLSFAQVTANPSIPTDNQEVEIIFDATKGNMGLMNYTGDIYAHTGLITSKSSSGSDWKYVLAAWTENKPELKLTKIGSNLYSLKITPTIRQFYKVTDATEVIKQMAFVFRNADGSREAKTEANGDIYQDVYPEGLSVSFTKTPSEIVTAGSSVTFSATANHADSLIIYHNATRISTTTTSPVELTRTLTEPGMHLIIAEAKDDTGVKRDTLKVFARGPVNVAPLPAGMKEGINYIDPQKVVLVLFAPHKEFVFAVGDFSQWEYRQEYYMNRTPDGNYYWVEIPNLVPLKDYVYQYWIDGKIRVGDPYADKVADPDHDPYISRIIYPTPSVYPYGKTTGIATALITGRAPYAWTPKPFVAPPKEKLNIYELLVRDFVGVHTFKAVRDSMHYFKKLGINAIELMPVQEFDGNLSWGYNPTYYFAHDKYYGPKNCLKATVDSMHRNNIAVILDVVFNQSHEKSPMVQMYWDRTKVTDDSPWYNQQATHDYNVFIDMNHESEATQRFVSNVLKYWLQEFRVDGFRFDLSKGFTQKYTVGNVAEWGRYDANRIAVLKKYADTIWSINPNAYVILEHFADNAEEKELADYGMMLWGNRNYNFAEATMGWLANSNFNSAWYKNLGWTKPHLITYMESHDEERLMYKNIQFGNSTNPQYNVKDTTIGLQRVELATVFFYSIPGPKMLWQFGDLGYDYSIDYNGRTGEKPIRWDYLQDDRRKMLYEVTGAMMHLRNSHEAFHTTDATVNAVGAVKTIVLKHAEMDVTVVGNFDVKSADATPPFTKNGYWYEYFTGDSIQVNSVSPPTMNLKPGEYRLYTSVRITDGTFPTASTLAETLNFRLFPNPAKDHFFIQPAVTEPVKVRMDLLDVSGRKIAGLYNGTVQPGTPPLYFNTSAYRLPAGMYLIHVSSGSSQQLVKLVLQ